MKVLYLEASPRGERSASTAVTEAFLAALLDAAPQVEVERVKLFEAPIPEFRAPAAEAKYKAMGAGADLTDAETASWRQVIGAVEQLKSADWLVISSPMWNYSIPYRLKQWIDVVVQPGLTFGVDESGTYKGLVTGKKTVLVLSRGGQYRQGDDPNDFQRPYLEKVLGMMGLTDVRTVLVQPMLAQGPERAAQALEQAKKEAAELAQEMARE